jgi:hypothetical protein
MGVLMCVHITIIKIYQVDQYKMIVIHTFHFKSKIIFSHVYQLHALIYGLKFILDFIFLKL